MALFAAVSLAFGVRFGLKWFEVTESSPLVPRSHLTAGALWILSVMGSLAAERLYDEDTLFPGGGEFARILRAIVQAAAVLSVFIFLSQSFYVSRSWFGVLLIGSAGCLMAARYAGRKVLEVKRAAGKLRRPAILVSSDPEAWDEWTVEETTEFEVKANVEAGAFESFVQTRGREPALHQGVVMIRARDLRADAFWRTLVVAGEQQWSVFVHSSVRSVGRDRLTIRDIGGQTIVRVGPPMLTGTKAITKRALDVALALAMGLALSPLWLGIAAIVLLRSGRPVLFRQERVGKGGRPFTMYKFRTMYPAAEEASGPVWTKPDDPRRTPVGAALRRMSLDELPQLFNVLRGDMSMVGPRPERPSFVEDFSETIDWYKFRHRIRPGITGWAQAAGLRGDTPLDPRIEKDNWYIENWSIWLDFQILLRTVRELFRGRNAY